MRIKLNFSKSTELIPIQNQSLVNSYVHKCLGKSNKYHDAKNDYCISNLQGGKRNKANDTVSFEDGGYIIVSSLNPELVNTFLIGVMNNQNFIGGMKFVGVDHIEEQFIDGWNHFATLSPFIIKEYTSKEKYSFVKLTEPDFSKKVKDYLINKISKIGNYDLTDFDVIVPNHAGHKVKPVLVKNTINKANQCHISIKCSAEVAKLIYYNGLGQSTGSGFGTIYKTENKHIYRRQD